MKGRSRTAVAAIVVVVALALALLPVGERVAAGVEWAREAGAAGALAFAAAYVLAPVLVLPAWPITVAVGFVHGPALGLLLASPPSVIGAALAFVAGRRLLRERIARRLAGRPRFAAVDEAIGEAGFRLVLLLRLSPLFPYNLLNYALAVTRVRLRDFVAASFLGMLPVTALWLYVGSLAGSVGELAAGRLPEAGAAGRAAYWVGLAATTAAAAVVTRAARRALERSLAGPEGGSAPAPLDGNERSC